CVNQPSEKVPSNIGFLFDINVETKFRTEDQLMIAICSVNVSDHETKSHLGNVKTAIAFYIENWTDLFNAKTNKLTIPNDLNVMFHSIIISTTRGIMFSQFRGTYLHNAFLPVVDPKSFVFEKRGGGE
ncbi:MAG: hypothetical protein RIF46_09355, partial [Cyclobacteriaceae bacterium]